MNAVNVNFNWEDYTLLIVDDNPTNLGVVVDYLEDSGLTILVSQDGESAITRAQFARPHLILLDVMMPGIDGFETCRRLKADPQTRDIPVIFMTALANTEDKVKGFEVGGVDYVTKPIQHEEVLVRVKTHLQIYDLNRQLEEQNQLLQQRVAERTAELERALQDLQQFQLQLVQSEKMSALGQLVAGVAHEMNNPIGFLRGNLEPAIEYVRDLLNHLRLYQQVYTEPPAEIVKSAEEIDLEFIVEDLPESIASMADAVERIGDISTSLRTFSRTDAVAKMPFNLHDGLDSTLLILKHRLKGNQKRPPIEIIKKYGELPEIECLPGQINQVFMNLLANAIDALEECSGDRCYADLQNEPHEIQIKTEIQDDKVIVRIGDNGVGMSEEVKSKMFEQGFTTKPVGKGTGLGMAIARQIVEEKHGGSLTCTSELGKGTEFLIEIPC